jgi:hypothetical protein
MSRLKTYSDELVEYCRNNRGGVIFAVIILLIGLSITLYTWQNPVAGSSRTNTPISVTGDENSKRLNETEQVYTIKVENNEAGTGYYVLLIPNGIYSQEKKIDINCW